MLFEYGNVKPNKTVMILGAAGNVGAYAVQLAVNAGLDVIGIVCLKDIEYVKALGSQTVVDYQASKFENAVRPVDLILDTVGGEARERSYSVLKSGGTLVSVVSDDPVPDRPDARSVFFYVEVTTERLNGISKLLNSRQLAPQVGTLLPSNSIFSGDMHDGQINAVSRIVRLRQLVDGVDRSRGIEGGELCPPLRQPHRRQGDVGRNGQPSRRATEFRAGILRHRQGAAGGGQ
jgi:Zinc-binding dehydrogenase